jgi:hypothetical protein
MVRLRPSRKDPGGGAAPIAYTSGWDVPVHEAARARQIQVRENQGEAHYALWLFAPSGMRSEVSNRYAHYALWLFVLAGMPVVGHRSTPRWLELTVLDIRSPA